jgi:hypothetical protein
LISSDLTTAENQDGTFSAIANVGISRSSMAGDITYSLTSMTWSTLDQFALSGGITKMDFKDGKLSAINSYSLTTAYLKGSYMALVGYTWIKPHPKFGVYGYNVGVVNLMTAGTEQDWDVSVSTSAVAFWTKPFQYSKKLTLSPQVFAMYSPLGYNTFTGNTLVGRHFGFLVGSSVDYKISKRFGFSFNYKMNLNTQPGQRMTNMFLIGSRMML